MTTKGERIREHILTSADELFYHQGYGATVFARLAEYSGIPKGNFYYYYKTKDDILRDVLDQRRKRIIEQLEGWEEQESTALGRLNRFIRMVHDNAENLSRYGCPIGTINSELGKDRVEMQPAAKLLISTYVDWLTRQFADYMALRPKQARQYAIHLMSMAEGAAMLGHVYNDAGLIRDETTRMKKWLVGLQSE